MLNKIIKFFLENRLVTVLVLLLFIGWGLITAPFGWQLGALPSDPVPVDAIPNIGANQQIVFTEWKGRSPQDIEDQITYPLTTYLLGIPGVESVRSTSVFGFSSIYLIFSDEVEFYWSRSRILEKLNSLPSGLLPEGVQPALGPDATALGQVYWYTLEGRDSSGQATGGWDPQEIRSVQDFYVKYGLNATEGVAEVASIGGYVKEYQINVRPEALKAYGIPLAAVSKAVKNSNQDVGAKTMEINQVEYLVRGLGYVEKIEDLEMAVVDVQDNVPIRIKDVAQVQLGPATRRGALDKGGAEVVGGVVVARHGANPLEVIKNVKAKIQNIAPGLPQKTLADGRVSKLTIVPFYDRSDLIYETLGTLEEALSLEMLITLLVVIVMVYHLRAALLISSILPLGVLMVFIAMRYFGITANIVALSGIAIAIGTMVDLGVILTENILKRKAEAPPGENLLNTVYQGASEVSSAILTAVATTVVSFIPVFTLQAAEGKLFSPLAYTKTFALIAALLITLLILPTLAYWLLGWRRKNRVFTQYGGIALLLLGLGSLFLGQHWAGAMLLALGGVRVLKTWGPAVREWPRAWQRSAYQQAELIIIGVGVAWLLARYWLPLGPANGMGANFLLVLLLVGLVLGGFRLLEAYYSRILGWCLAHKGRFLLLPTLLILLALNIWLGFSSVFGFMAQGFQKVGWDLQKTTAWQKAAETFPGIGTEFMPALDEGSFLLMPSNMPHAGMAYNQASLAQMDRRLAQIPEVEEAVGKLGRAETPLDPAPLSMFETMVNYKPEYAVDRNGRRRRFRVDQAGHFITRTGDTLAQAAALQAGISAGALIPDEDGRYFRNWRRHIESPDDIWQEIVAVTQLPGLTSAPKLQPIETRQVMLQSGMRAPMGIKVFGPDLASIQDFALQLESTLKEVPSVKREAVFAERVVGKPYLHLDIDREKMARYGLSVAAVQQTIETAIGGVRITSTVEGRRRFPVRVRYPRERRHTPQTIGKILMDTPTGTQVPLRELLDIRYKRGPQAIKSEETFKVGYVTFDRKPGLSEGEVVDETRSAIQAQVEQGNLSIPPGVSYTFSGNYKNQVRAEKRLSLIVPLVLGVVFLILYFQFRSVSTAFMVFSGIAMAFSGGFILLWLYGQSWFLDFSLWETSFRDLFQIQTIHLSVAVWVGFIALFGIATDDGVLIASYLDSSHARHKPHTQEGVRAAVMEAGRRRVRPALMTAATTMLALLPILSSTGRGADIMVPMAIPSFGGLAFALVSIFIVPVLYAWREERKLKTRESKS
ncbi:MAG: efflux RND transporter permease subunit [Schleiferiaceae bacterium]|nr:efflux RND transporter permease subunit [Schleiferiaceae bacterium]